MINFDVLGQKDLEEGEELVMDEQAYIIYHQASLGPPCLSFDIIQDDLGQDRADSYPMTIYGVAGTQASKMAANSVVVFKMSNLHPIKRKVKNDDEDSEDESEDEGTVSQKSGHSYYIAMKLIFNHSSFKKF